VPSPLFGISFLGALMPITPAYNEADVSDKPQRLQSRPPIRTPTLRGIAEEWRQRQRSLQSVDIGVKRLVDSLRETGQLENTIIVFTSDNGYMNGEHRITGGKVQPYEPSIRVPLLMRGPGVPAGERREQLVWNGDLAPTILEAAGARASWVPDGQSLWPVVRDADAPGDDAVLLEGPPRGTASAAPRFIGVRTERYTWIEHVDGIPELYDLRRDPFQLRNMARTPEGKRIGRILSRRVARLRDCSGATCR
jgi:arylsulfatase A-like enzyme